MSLLTHADLLRTHLVADAGLAGVCVHVDRKFDIRELATAELGKKTSGAFLAISLAGWVPEEADAGPGEYWGRLRYELAFATIPHILEELDLPTFDELLRRIVLAVQGWTPPGSNPAYCAPMRWSVGAGSYVPDDTFLTYLFPASISEDFANPAVIPD